MEPDATDDAELVGCIDPGGGNPGKALFGVADGASIAGIGECGGLGSAGA